MTDVISEQVLQNDLQNVVAELGYPARELSPRILLSSDIEAMRRTMLETWSGTLNERLTKMTIQDFGTSQNSLIPKLFRFMSLKQAVEANLVSNTGNTVFWDEVVYATGDFESNSLRHIPHILEEMRKTSSDALVMNGLTFEVPLDFWTEQRKLNDLYAKIKQCAGSLATLVSRRILDKLHFKAAEQYFNNLPRFPMQHNDYATFLARRADIAMCLIKDQMTIKAEKACQAAVAQRNAGKTDTWLTPWGSVSTMASRPDMRDYFRAGPHMTQGHLEKFETFGEYKTPFGHTLVESMRFMNASSKKMYDPLVHEEVVNERYTVPSTVLSGVQGRQYSSGHFAISIMNYTTHQWDDFQLLELLRHGGIWDQSTARLQYFTDIGLDIIKILCGVGSGRQRTRGAIQSAAAASQLAAEQDPDGDEYDAVVSTSGASAAADMAGMGYGPTTVAPLTSDRAAQFGAADSAAASMGRFDQMIRRRTNAYGQATTRLETLSGSVNFSGNKTALQVMANDPVAECLNLMAMHETSNTGSDAMNVAYERDTEPGREGDFLKELESVYQAQQEKLRRSSDANRGRSFGLNSTSTSTSIGRFSGSGASGLAARPVAGPSSSLWSSAVGVWGAAPAPALPLAPLQQQDMDKFSASVHRSSFKFITPAERIFPPMTEKGRLIYVQCLMLGDEDNPKNSVEVSNISQVGIPPLSPLEDRLRQHAIDMAQTIVVGVGRYYNSNTDTIHQLMQKLTANNTPGNLAYGPEVKTCLLNVLRDPTILSIMESVAQVPTGVLLPPKISNFANFRNPNTPRYLSLRLLYVRTAIVLALEQQLVTELKNNRNVTPQSVCILVAMFLLVEWRSVAFDASVATRAITDSNYGTLDIYNRFDITLAAAPPATSDVCNFMDGHSLSFTRNVIERHARNDDWFRALFIHTIFQTCFLSRFLFLKRPVAKEWYNLRNPAKKQYAAPNDVQTLDGHNFTKFHSLAFDWYTVNKSKRDVLILELANKMGTLNENDAWNDTALAFHPTVARPLMYKFSQVLQWMTRSTLPTSDKKFVRGSIRKILSTDEAGINTLVTDVNANIIVDFETNVFKTFHVLQETRLQEEGYVASMVANLIQLRNVEPDKYDAIVREEPDLASDNASADASAVVPVSRRRRRHDDEDDDQDAGGETTRIRFIMPREERVAKIMDLYRRIFPTYSVISMLYRNNVIVPMRPKPFRWNVRLRMGSCIFLVKGDDCGFYIVKRLEQSLIVSERRYMIAFPVRFEGQMIVKNPQCLELLPNAFPCSIVSGGDTTLFKYTAENRALFTQRTTNTNLPSIICTTVGLDHEDPAIWTNMSGHMDRRIYAGRYQQGAYPMFSTCAPFRRYFGFDSGGNQAYSEHTYQDYFAPMHMNHLNSVCAYQRSYNVGDETTPPGLSKITLGQTILGPVVDANRLKDIECLRDFSGNGFFLTNN